MTNFIKQIQYTRRVSVGQWERHLTYEMMERHRLPVGLILLSDKIERLGASFFPCKKKLFYYSYLWARYQFIC